MVKESIVRLAKQENKTVLLTTHQLDIVEEICDRVAIINKGKLIALDSAEKLRSAFGREYYEVRLQGRPGTDHQCCLRLVCRSPAGIHNIAKILYRSPFRSGDGLHPLYGLLFCGSGF